VSEWENGGPVHVPTRAWMVKVKVPAVADILVMLRSLVVVVWESVVRSGAVFSRARLSYG
jgi:hypothetical protein